jgi:hypothetical protein
MTTPQEPAPDSDTRPDDDGADPSTAHTGRESTSAEDVETDGPLDADEGDPDLDAYPG